MSRSTSSATRWRGPAPFASNPNRVGALAVLFDAVSVLVFVAIGRRNHDNESGNVADSVACGIASVAAPFLIALAVAWAVAAAQPSMRNRPFAVRTGLVVWPITVVVGMLLRRFVFDRGTAVSFVIVATIATGVLFIGWRVIANSRRSSAPAT